jgi:hypothetical protein
LKLRRTSPSALAGSYHPTISPESLIPDSYTGKSKADNLPCGIYTIVDTRADRRAERIARKICEGPTRMLEVNVAGLRLRNANDLARVIDTIEHCANGGAGAGQVAGSRKGEPGTELWPIGAHNRAEQGLISRDIGRFPMLLQ